MLKKILGVLILVVIFGSIFTALCCAAGIWVGLLVIGICAVLLGLIGLAIWLLTSD